MPLPTRKIGTDNVTAIGFGLMGLSGFYGAIDSDEERFKVSTYRLYSIFVKHKVLTHKQLLDTAVEVGCTNWDTAAMYGDSEELVGKWCVVGDSLSSSRSADAGQC